MEMRDCDRRFFLVNKMVAIEIGKDAVPMTKVREIIKFKVWISFGNIPINLVLYIFGSFAKTRIE